MQDGILIKVAFGGLVFLLAAIFLWQPLTLPFSGTVSSNDFVLHTAAEGVLDSKSLRGKVMAVIFTHSDCQSGCDGYIGRLAKAYDLLNPGERSFVRLIMIAANPEKDTPAAMAEHARHYHADFIGLSGKPEDVQKVADGFAAMIKKGTTGDGRPVVSVSPMVYIVNAEGHFASVLNEQLAAEDIAKSLRARIPPQLPPGR